MAEQRRNYRQQQPAKQEEAPKSQGYSGNRGGGNRGGGDSKFVRITGLFRSKSGKADTVFATPQILDKLAEIQEGDTIGISEGKDGKLSLWFVPNNQGA